MTARGIEHLVRVVILLLINKKIKINTQIIARRKFSEKADNPDKVDKRQ